MTNTSFSCTYKIFTSKPNLITKFGIEKSLHTDSCHHSIVFGKMNINVPLPLPYTSEVCDDNKADRKYIHRSIKTCNWAKLFINLTTKGRMELLSNTN